MKQKKPEPLVVVTSDGVTLANLLLQSRSWIHRCVDTIALDDDGRSWQRTSLDLTPPGSYTGSALAEAKNRESSILPHWGVIRGSRNRIILPIGFFKKGVGIRGFGIIGPKGSPLSVLTTAKNVDLVFEMLVSLLPNLFFEIAAHDELIVRNILSIAERNKSVDQSAKSDVRNWIIQLKNDPRYSHALEEKDAWDIFEQVALSLAEEFLMLVEVDVELQGVRSLIKVSFEIDLEVSSEWHLGTISVSTSLWSFGIAASHHCELRLPGDLVLTKMALNENAEVGRDARFRELRRRLRFWRGDSGHKEPVEVSTGHVSCAPPNSDKFASGYMRAQVEPARQGISSITVIAIWGMLFLCLASICFRIWNDFFLRPIHSAPTSVISVLLAVTAVLLSWRSMRREHTLTGILFSPFRKILLWSSLALAILAVLLSLMFDSWVWHVGWYVIYGITLAVIYTYWKLWRVAYSAT
ncbi:hypothetical protein [Arthrobacter sp. YC-RL1]|uniref:hypothetical protein n=1 Tax=Arthrobacter sp. YC-RL1 TaxID=1652545 RepID=UPI00128C2C42|nr:hypothetical protein [Arthrobacter sp. YC-RL1]